MHELWHCVYTYLLYLYRISSPKSYIIIIIYPRSRSGHFVFRVQFHYCVLTFNTPIIIILCSIPNTNYTSKYTILVNNIIFVNYLLRKKKYRVFPFRQNIVMRVAGLLCDIILLWSQSKSFEHRTIDNIISDILRSYE